MPDCAARIGRGEAAASEHPHRPLGQAIELAGDVANRRDLVRALRAGGLRPAITRKVPGMLQGRLPDEYALMMKWIDGGGFQADLPALHAQFPGLTMVDAWARRAVQ